MAASDILTVQYVHITPVLASVWDRCVARFIDHIVQIIYIVALFTMVLDDMDLSTTWEYIILFAVFVPFFFYDLLWETFNNGMSIGKYLMGLRVVSADGDMPTMGGYLMRWLLMLIEGPSLGYIGLIPMLVTKRHQRFGDMLAGTMVIKLGKHHAYDVSLEEYSYLTDDYKPTYPQAAELSPRQAEIITRTLEPLSANRESRIELLAQKVAKVMGIEKPRISSERFLFTVVHDFHFYEMP